MDRMGRRLVGLRPIVCQPISGRRTAFALHQEPVFSSPISSCVLWSDSSNPHLVRVFYPEQKLASGPFGEQIIEESCT